MMTIWRPDIDLTAAPAPRYAALADAIAEAIDQGELGPGAQLPPQRRLAWRIGVSVGTVTRAYDLLRRRGRVEGTVGRGTFVRGPAEASASSDGLLNLAQNLPSLGPHGSALGATLAELGRGADLAPLLGYPPAGGAARHRAAGARWLARRGLTADAADLVVTAGVQQALAAVLGTFGRAGRRLLIEELTYFGLIEILTELGLEAIPVRIDDEGVDPAAVARVAEPGAVLTVVPGLHNPTNGVLSTARRRALADLARRHDMILVEDDVYGILDPGLPPPLASLAPERTVYIASVSKSLAIGFRIGWLLAPAALRAPLAAAVHADLVGAPGLMAELVARWLDDGTADRLIAWQRTEAAARQAIAAEVLAGLDVRGHAASFHVYLRLGPPWRARDLVQAVREEGVDIVAAEAFALDPAAAPEAVRLSLSAVPDRPSLRRALTLVRDRLAAGPRRRAII